MSEKQRAERKLERMKQLGSVRGYVDAFFREAARVPSSTPDDERRKVQLFIAGIRNYSLRIDLSKSLARNESVKLQHIMQEAVQLDEAAYYTSSKWKSSAPTARVNNISTPFQGTCHKCGKFGHKAIHCPAPSNTNSGSSRGGRGGRSTSRGGRSYGRGAGRSSAHAPAESLNS